MTIREAHASQQQMFQLITGYWGTQAVAAFASLGLADELASGPADADDLAPRVGADAAALHRLLRACATLGVVAVHPSGWALTPLGETLRADAPGSLRGMAIMQAAPGHWLPWGRFCDAVRSGRRQTAATLGAELFDYYANEPEEAAAFSAAMEGLSAMVAESVVALGIPFRHAVDVGGAKGTLLDAVLRAGGRGTLFDLAHVVDARPTNTRIDLVAGDFFRQVPSGDLYLLKQILHDWDDAQCVTILSNVARAADPGATLLIVEMVLPEQGPSPASLMDLNMLALLPGRERTLSEYQGLLARAGLRFRQVHDTGTAFQVVEARR